MRVQAFRWLLSLLVMGGVLAQPLRLASEVLAANHFTAHSLKKPITRAPHRVRFTTTEPEELRKLARAAQQARTGPRESWWLAALTGSLGSGPASPAPFTAPAESAIPLRC